jgi:hypothetical protein
MFLTIGGAMVVFGLLITQQNKFILGKEAVYEIERFDIETTAMPTTMITEPNPIDWVNFLIKL